MVGAEPPHSLSHLTNKECYDLLIAERASLVAARQVREDGLIGTITQVSSAALLLIPGTLASASKIPNFSTAPILYLGIIGFFVALCSSLLEQWFSGKAYQKQQEVTEAYYLRKSEQTYDEISEKRVRRTQIAAFVSFGLALLFSVVGFIRLQ